MDIVKVESDVIKETKEEICTDKAKTEATPPSHEELIRLTKTVIANIIKSDSHLSKLHPDITLEELKSLIAVEQGQAITLFVNRGELPKLSVAVHPHKTTILDLKKNIKRSMNLALRRENVEKKISWRHIWKKYHLCFENVRLVKNGENIKAYGITNKTELYFVKKRREKNK